MTEHTTATPGPWTVRTDGEVADADFGPDVRWPWQIVGPDGQVIVDFSGGTEISDEDARLIAAAPSMLKALMACVDALTPMDALRDIFGDFPVLDNARAVIAKATDGGAA